MTQFEFEVLPSACDPTEPLIYLWQVRDAQGRLVYQYVGKAVRGAARPLTHYRRNVHNLLNNRPYRRLNPAGFRTVHHELAQATRRGDRITLTYLVNVPPDGDINVVEREWQRQVLG